jgi:glycosyltransferase involved in cell wall biosynthesis
MNGRTPMVRISTIIPAYNSAAFLAAAIRSALGQVGVENQVIVVDDGSTDDTGRVIDSFGNAIQSARTEKVGPYKTRNLGAKLAEGEWLAFLDADDEWLPEKLSKQVALADDQADLIYTDRINFGSNLRVSDRQSDIQELWDGDVFEHLLLDNFITLSSVLIRKKAFNALGGFGEDQFGVMDWDLWLRFAASGRRVAVCREALTRYRWHPGSVSSDFDQRCADRLAVVRRALALPRGRQVPRSLARRAEASAWEISAWFAAGTRPGKAIAWYVRSALCWPWNTTAYKGILKCCLGRK